MSDLRGEAPYGSQAFGLKQPLLHRAEVRTVLKDMNQAAAVIIVGVLDRHVQQFLFASPGQYQQRSIDRSPFARAGDSHVIVDIPDNTELMDVSLVGADGRNFEDMFCRRRHLDNGAVHQGNEHAFMHASHALFCILQLFATLEIRSETLKLIVHCIHAVAIGAPSCHCAFLLLIQWLNFRDVFLPPSPWRDSCRFSPLGRQIGTISPWPFDGFVFMSLSDVVWRPDNRQQIDDCSSGTQRHARKEKEHEGQRMIPEHRYQCHQQACSHEHACNAEAVLNF